MKDNMKIHLINKLQDITKELKLNEQQYMNKYKEFVGDEVNYNSSQTGTNQNMLQLRSDVNPQIQQRGQEIETLVKSIEELGQIFKDLQLLVVQQGSILDRIDHNIDQAFVNTKKAHKELVAANESMKSNCARNSILVLIVIIFVEALLLLIKFM
jgi:syntaxin 16